jgi:hypothetical protein
MVERFDTVERAVFVKSSSLCGGFSFSFSLSMVLRVVFPQQSPRPILVATPLLVQHSLHRDVLHVVLYSDGLPSAS